MSLVPDAIDGLFAVVSTAASKTPTSPAWRVVDGAPVGSTGQALACIAFTGTAGAVAVTEVVDPTSTPNPRRAEKVYEIVSQLSRFAGNGTVRAQRQECYRLANAIEAEILADRTLGGAIQGSAWWAGSTYTSATEGGPIVVVEFTVHVKGFET